MAWEHEKSGATIFLDVLRYLLILAATGFTVFVTWKRNWIIALIGVIPVYLVMLNFFGFLTLPLYALTPENRLKVKIMKACQSGDIEKGVALGNEFVQKFNVNDPERLSPVSIPKDSPKKYNPREGLAYRVGRWFGNAIK